MLDLERLFVFCACGSRGGAASGTVIGNMVMVRYIGDRIASQTFIVNGRRYIFGDNHTHKVMPVYDSDVTKLFDLNPGLFELV